MSEKKEAEETKESEVNADVKHLAQQIADECKMLIAEIETLDANKWLSHANTLESLNNQLQGLLVP